MQPDSNQYGFIMDPSAQQQKKSLLPGGGFSGMSKTKLIALVGGVVVVLAIIITLLFSFLNSGPSNKDQLIKVAQQQNELIRISEVAIKEARGTQARNLAATTQQALRSDQSSLIAALKSQKLKVGAKDLKAAKSAENDKLLTEAMQNNRFDEVYLEFIQEALVDYQRNLNEAYKTTTSPGLKATMKMQYENASLIIGVDPEA